MGLKNLITKVYHGMAWFFHRPGIEEFLTKYQFQAMKIVTNLAEVNNYAKFAQWKDEAFRQVKEIAGDAHDNWVTILIHLAYENLKGERRLYALFTGTGVPPEEK